MIFFNCVIYEAANILKLSIVLSRLSLVRLDEIIDSCLTSLVIEL